MSLLPDDVRQQLLENSHRQEAVRGTDQEIDFEPVVRLFTPDGPCTWLITELAADGDTLFGLADLGMGCPELGAFSRAELGRVRGCLGLPIERDLGFSAERTLSACARRAQIAGRIVD